MTGISDNPQYKKLIEKQEKLYKNNLLDFKKFEVEARILKVSIEQFKRNYYDRLSN